MKIDDVIKVVGDTPHTSPAQGRELYEFVLANDISEVLELGFAHGVSTCYIAAALHERGDGRVRTVDLPQARDLQPSLWDLLARLSLGNYVSPVVADTSYNWVLMDWIQERSHAGFCQPMFDFCFLDGAHTWETDGFAFFLVDKLLQRGSYILFDDVRWTLAGSRNFRDAPWVRALPPGQQETPQVERIVNLLARQHEHYEDPRLEGGWAWVRKRPEPFSAETTDDWAALRQLVREVNTRLAELVAVESRREERSGVRSSRVEATIERQTSVLDRVVQALAAIDEAQCGYPPIPQPDSRAEAELQAVLESRSLRIGRAVTAPVRALKRAGKRRRG